MTTTLTNGSAQTQASLSSRAARAVLDALPRGQPLPEDMWRTRHAAVRLLLFAHAVAIVGFGLYQGYTLGHSLLEASLVVVFAIAASGQRSRVVRSTIASFGLITCSAILTHMAHGVIEMHFHFFIMLSVIALYQEWAPFLVSILYVLVHHGLGGVVDPHSVYDHQDALVSPWKWAAIHAGFVSGACIVYVVSWRLNEAERDHARNVLHSAGEGIVGVDTQGRVLFMNPAAEKITGYGSDSLLGRPIAGIIQSASDPSQNDKAEVHSAGVTTEGSIHRPDGTAIPADVVQTDIVSRGNVRGSVLTFRNVTERKRREDESRRAQQLLAAERQIMEMIAAGASLPEVLGALCSSVEEQSDGVLCSVLLLDAAGKHLRHGAAPSLPDAYVRAVDHLPIGPNAGSCGTAAYTRQPVIVADVRRDARWADYMDLAVSHGLIACWSTPMLSKNGDVLGTFACYYREPREPSNRDLDLIERAKHVAGIAIERARSAEMINHMAYHDALTGLPNWALFRDRLTMSIAQARRSQKKLAVMFLDLDRFKLVNDTVGHAGGDELITGVARQLERLLRDGDSVARVGGDEFTLLLPDIEGVEDVVGVSKRILNTLEQPRVVCGSQFQITTSVGIAIYPGDGEDADALLRNADSAMYGAKEGGRNNYQLYTAAMNADVRERLALGNDLRLALEHSEFAVYYQPVVDVNAGTIVGAEALVRWQHPTRGLVAPEGFIRLAEETGLIVPIGEMVLRTACAQCRLWQNDGYRLRVTVNFSARQFQQPNMASMIRRVLAETGLEAKSLTLEITEGILMRDLDLAVTVLSELRRMGVQISIDDFGIGYSSLNYLKRLPVDELKIDRSFVQDITVDADNAAIVEAVIALASSLKLRIVAEGVETVEQRSFLQERNCTEMQGYLFGRPMPAEEMTGALRVGNVALLARRSGRPREQ